MLLHQQALHVATVPEAISRILKGENAFKILHGFVASNLADKLGIVPGAEFFHARVAADRVDADVYTIDRPVSITLSRAWGSLSTWSKLRFAWQAFSEGLRDMDAKELKELIEEIKRTSQSDLFTDMIRQAAQEYPTLVHAILTERDSYLAINMCKVARELVYTCDSVQYVQQAYMPVEEKYHRASLEGEVCLVAVVGAGHLDGIVENWERVNMMSEMKLDEEIEALITVPSVSWKARVVNKGIKYGIISTLLMTTGVVAYATFKGGSWLVRKSVSVVSSQYARH
mmetsp:Transcript_7992/g.14812  ORF Transcript_7992/g.14812 Transcript_7992/m.14812 type:complete len:285 (-) Transcript_7992:18-872(-)